MLRLLVHDHTLGSKGVDQGHSSKKMCTQALGWGHRNANTWFMVSSLLPTITLVGWST